MTIKFYVEVRKDDDGKPLPLKEAPIYMYVRTGRSAAAGEKGVRNTIKINTGEKVIPKKHWNFEEQRIKRGTPGEAEIREALSNMETKVRRIFNRLTDNGKAVSFDELRDEIISHLKGKVKDTQKDFFDAFETFMNHKAGESLSSLTLARYKGLRNHLENFKKSQRFNISFENIDQQFLQKLIRYFIQVEKHTNNSITKNIQLLKTFLNWAIQEKYTSNLTFKKFKGFKSMETDVIYLTEIELMNLYHFDFSKHSSLEKARDIFCFQCFTGQRFSDIKSITRDDIKGNVWNVRTAKTDELLYIPLNEFALEVLEKYKRLASPLPLIAEQNVNIFIKQACEMVGINENVKRTRFRGSEALSDQRPKFNFISTHIARKTFITLSLLKGMPVYVLMKITGHEDYEAMKPYIKIAEPVQKSEMERVWNRDNIRNMKTA